MIRLRIKDIGEDKCLSFDLIDLLTLLKEELEHFTFKVLFVEQMLYRNINLIPSGRNLLDMEGELISFSELLGQSSNIVQIVDGQFEGSNNGDFVHLIAFDSTFWEIETNVPQVVEKVKGQFTDVEVEVY